MRIDRLREDISAVSVDAALITTPENVTYYSGFTGVSSQLLITQNDTLFFTDFRYTEQAQAETEFDVVETKGDSRVQTIFEYAKKLGVCRIGVDLSGVSCGAYKAYIKHTAEENIVDISSAIAKRRAVKDEGELALIAKGAVHNDKLFAHMCSLMKPGMTEYDIKAELMYYMHKNGAEAAFPPIVASGEHSSLPHATPTDRKVLPGDLVTMDYGCRFDGYCSDFTRTVAISHIDKERQKVYDIVKCAGDMATQALTAGISAKAVDAVARDYIASHGYGDYFGHGTGHGVGLFIHEAPAMNAQSDAILQENMVVTVEPGIYLPGRFGVRIEDLLVVKDGGCVNYTSAPREVVII
jgi:Xaa-Pro aminopeptidase